MYIFLGPCSFLLTSFFFFFSELKLIYWWFISGKKPKPSRPESPTTTPNISVKKKNKDGKGKSDGCH